MTSLITRGRINPVQKSDPLQDIVSGWYKSINDIKSHEERVKKLTGTLKNYKEYIVEASAEKSSEMFNLHLDLISEQASLVNAIANKAYYEDQLMPFFKLWAENKVLVVNLQNQSDTTIEMFLNDDGVLTFEYAS